MRLADKGWALSGDELVDEEGEELLGEGAESADDAEMAMLSDESPEEDG
jgi:hypothetical protein